MTSVKWDNGNYVTYQVSNGNWIVRNSKGQQIGIYTRGGKTARYLTNKYITNKNKTKTNNKTSNSNSTTTKTNNNTSNTSTDTSTSNKTEDNTTTEDTITDTTRDIEYDPDEFVPETPYTQTELLPSNNHSHFVMLDVYKTDEENYTKYTGYSTEETTITDTNDRTDEDEDVDIDIESLLSEVETSDEDKGYYAHLGKITEIFNYYQTFNASYEDDYSGFKGSGKIKFPNFTKDQLKEVYKGVRTLLKYGRFNPQSDNKEIHVKPVLLSFITESDFNREGAELKLEDEGILLEDKEELTYNSMLRSEILKEVIRHAGLTPEVDFRGLQDEVISWTSVSSTGSDSSTAGQSTEFDECSTVLEMTNKFGFKVGTMGTIPSNITNESMAKIGKSTAPYASAVQGKSAKEVWKICKQGLVYTCYECNRDKCASQSWNNKHLNCGDSARLLKCCMDIAGVPCIIIHGPHHFYNAVKVNGKWVTADLCYVNNRKGTNQLMN